jgi:hypothetical protein
LFFNINSIYFLKKLLIIILIIKFIIQIIKLIILIIILNLEAKNPRSSGAPKASIVKKRIKLGLFEISSQAFKVRTLEL